MPGVPRLKSAILGATSAAGVYLFSVLLHVSLEWICALYALTLGACVWMTVRILKDPWSTDKTFDDYFYQDRPDIRRVGREETKGQNG